MLPCGTPQEIFRGAESTWLTLTICVLSHKYDLNHSTEDTPMVCVYNHDNSIIDLFREGYRGLKSKVWQLIPRWSSGSVV